MCRQGVCRASLPSAEAGIAAVWLLSVPYSHVPAVGTERFQPLHPGTPTVLPGLRPGSEPSGAVSEEGLE